MVLPCECGVFLLLGHALPAPWALLTIFSVQEPGAHLSVVGGTGVTCCWRPPHTPTVPTADAEPRRLVEMGAPSTAFL